MGSYYSLMIVEKTNEQKQVNCFLSTGFQLKLNVETDYNLV